MRLAFRLTFVDGLAALKQGKRHHPGWWADPHLRKGYLYALPVLIVGFIGVGSLLRPRMFQDSGLAFGFFLVVGLLANVVWFAVSARSRAKG